MSDPTPPFNVQALRDALAPAVANAARVIRQIHTAMRPLIEYVEQHPEALEQWRREREAEERLGSCHCLCGANHGDRMGVCTSVAEPGLTVTFHSQVHVPMCRPCFEARQAVLA